MVEASRGAVVPTCSPECMELGIGVWEGSSDRLQTADGAVDFTSDPPLSRDLREGEREA